MIEDYNRIIKSGFDKETRVVLFVGSNVWPQSDEHMKSVGGLEKQFKTRNTILTSVFGFSLLYLKMLYIRFQILNFLGSPKSMAIAYVVRGD